MKRRGRNKLQRKRYLFRYKSLKFDNIVEDTRYSEIPKYFIKKNVSSEISVTGM